MNDDRKVTMQLTVFEANCIDTIRMIQKRRNKMIEWNGVIICSAERYNDLVREKIRWQKIADEMEMEKDEQSGKGN